MRTIQEYGISVFHRAQQQLFSFPWSMKTVIAHGKVVDSVIEVGVAFFERSKMDADKAFQASLKHLKGWEASMTIVDTLQDVVKKIASFTANQTYKLGFELVGLGSGAVNKLYDTGSFLEQQLAIPLMKGFSQGWKAVHFQALRIGCLARSVVEGGEVAAFFRGEIDRFEGVKHTFKLIDNGAGAVFATAILGGMSPSVIAASSAISSTARLSEYYWSNIIF